MSAYLLANGNLVIPIRAESNGAIGDAMIVIGPTHPDYQRWHAEALTATPEVELEFGNAVAVA